MTEYFIFEGKKFIPEQTNPPEWWRDQPEYYALPDCENPWWGKKPRKAAPAPAIMFTSSSPDNYPDTTYAPYTPEWQLFDKRLLSLKKHGKLYDDLTPALRGIIDGKFKDLYAGNKAWTDRHGVESANPMRESLISLGYSYRKIGEARARGGRWNGESMKGTDMIRLLSFIASEGPPDLTRYADPMKILQDPRVFMAKTIRKDCVTGNFPHLDGQAVPVAFITSGAAWVPDSCFRTVKK